MTHKQQTNAKYLEGDVDHGCCRFVLPTVVWLSTVDIVFLELNALHVIVFAGNIKRFQNLMQIYVHLAIIHAANTKPKNNYFH